MNYWISVKERLPKTKEDVIVWNKKTKSHKEDYYINSENLPGWANSRQDEISHWMSKGNWNYLIKTTLNPAILQP